MIKNAFLAAAIGLSFTGIWQCLMLAFAMGVIDKTTGIEFILGRSLGLLLIGFVLGVLGARLYVSSRIIFIVLGLLCLIFAARVLFKRNTSGPKPKRILGFGFGLGFLKGFTPCMKVWLVLPLLLGKRIPENLFIIFVLVLSSSLYPLIALFFSRLIKQTHIRKIEYIGAMVLVVIGAIYVFKGVTPCF